MARHLGEVGALTMEHHSVPNTQMARLTEALTADPKGSYALFLASAGTCTHMHIINTHSDI